MKTGTQYRADALPLVSRFSGAVEFVGNSRDTCAKNGETQWRSPFVSVRTSGATGFSAPAGPDPETDYIPDVDNRVYDKEDSDALLHCGYLGFSGYKHRDA